MSRIADYPGDALEDLKGLLAARRDAIRTHHENGGRGSQVCSALTDACDEVLRRVFQGAVEALPSAERPTILDNLALVAVGGYGRAVQAPHSDVDLLFLHRSEGSREVRDFVSVLVRTLWDVGLKLSQSVRSPADCVAFARRDLPGWTALMETRLVVGNDRLYADLQANLQRMIRSCSVRRFAASLIAERAPEHRDYHPRTVYLLEPNIKKSPGGLRDAHVFRWVAAARYGSTDMQVLQHSGAISGEDAGTLADAVDFLLRIRNELHFHAGMAQDVLAREEQLRLARWLGFERQGALLGVERFMRHYYRQTTGLQDVVARFVERVRGTSVFRSVVDRFMTHRTADGFMVGPNRIWANGRVSDSELRQAKTLLLLFDLARGFGVAVDHDTLERVRAAVPACAVTQEARGLFLRCLANPLGLGGLLRNLHRVGLLERLLPAFDHARCLIQFNLMHKYTVDEHSLQAVEAAVRRADDHGPLGWAYRAVTRKDILHLALLLHDLGKGLGDDHSEIGRTIAEEVARELGFDEHDRRLLVFLVHQHLLMAHTAFRRDVSDVQTLVRFARAVATPEMLRMLFVMTAADTEAVAPGEWTGWKETLLNELYFRTLEALTGETPVEDEAGRATALREKLKHELSLIPDLQFPPGWAERQIDQMPLSYLLFADADRAADHLRTLQKLDLRGVRTAAAWLPESQLCEYTVVTWDSIAPGLFSRIAGTLAASGFQIVGAKIVTRDDGLVIDTFWGADLDFAGEPPAGRRQEICELIQQVLLDQVAVESLLARRARPAIRMGPKPAEQPPLIEIDNESSSQFTIIEVFADDRPGLLYAITRTLFEQGLVIHSARIATHVDQIVDAFYVSDVGGNKVTYADRLEEIRDRLLAAI